MKNIIITRKIQVYVNEPDKDLKKDFIHTLYSWRDLVYKGANIVISHKFVQDNVREFVYLKDEIKEKFYFKDILQEKKGMSEQNTTYRILSEIMKGHVPADIYSCLNQLIVNTYKETRKDLYTGKKSISSYKNNIPIPFSAKAVANIHWIEESKKFNFVLFGIPFSVALGRDRSDNKVIIERCMDNNNSYKICSSSLKIDDKKKKMFLYLTISFPQENVELDKDKSMFASLDIETPIIAFIENKQIKIGTKDEYLHRRLQIQYALRRMQINAKYNVGGKGRKRKMQTIDKWHDIEKNYISTKLHQYSRMLIDLTIKNRCGNLILKDTPQGNEIKENKFLLRNWSYHGLIDKIKYKCAKYGVNLIIE